MEKEEFLTAALHKWDDGRWNESVDDLRALVYYHNYMPAYPEYLWRIWGDGRYYDEFMETLQRGIAAGSADCEYIKLWKEFSNRPADDEYWRKIYDLVDKKQKNALLALGLHKYLYANRYVGIEMMCESFGCSASVENLSSVYQYGTLEDKKKIVDCLNQEQLESVLAAKSIEIRPHVYEHKYTHHAAMLINSKFTNEHFNGYIFTTLRHLERKRIAAGIAPTYADIKDTILKNLPSDVKVIEGLSKNSWTFTSEEQHSKEAMRHSIYLTKKMPDGKWMTLRLGDHTLNTGDYYKYRKIYTPSDNPFANMCIMLHGDREQEAGLSYSFRFRYWTCDPCVTVRDEDFQLYRPFTYMIAHYLPGLIEDNGKLLSEKINKWFNTNAKEQFSDPYYSKEGPCARIQHGITMIETWDMKYERRKNKVYPPEIPDEYKDLPKWLDPYRCFY